MREDYSVLVVILKQVIDEYEKKIEQLKIINNSSVEMYKDEIHKLELDLMNIVNIDFDVFKKVFEDSDMDQVEANKALEYIKTIKILLENNVNNSTTFKLYDSQKKYIDLFFREVSKLRDRNNKILEENKYEINKLTPIYEKYCHLLKLVTDDRSREFIEDMDLINDLFNECDIDSFTKRKILLSLVKYNKEVYDRLMLDERIKPKIDKLNINEVIELFNLFGYDFMILDEGLRNDILSYADLSNMEDIFNCLNDLSFPMFNLKTSGKKLVTILINCDKEIFTEIVKYSEQKGITPKDLVSLIPALIKQTKATREGKGPGGDRESSPIIGGRSEDYKKNIKFLEDIGFRIDYVFNKCREVLIMNHERLKENYKKFIEYGFKFDSNSKGELSHPAFSCFLTGRFEKVVDQFIETSELGYKYIKDNMSRITTVGDSHSTIFYNIYASYMDKDNLGEELIPDGPFVNENAKKIRLRGEITRYYGSGYEDIPYRGITDENKKEKTMTDDISFINKDLFEKAVEEYYDGDISLQDMTYNDESLDRLDSYTDIDCPYRYNFDGILISKLKVKRIYNVLKNRGLDSYENSLLFAVTYNSILNKETFDKLSDMVKGRMI